MPLVACAQLSRAATARVDKRPILSDLRDSGSIEQDADVVMFIHREGYYDPACEEKNVGEIILAKQRNGPLGTVKVAWLSEFATYANLAPEQGGGSVSYTHLDVYKRQGMFIISNPYREHPLAFHRYHYPHEQNPPLHGGISDQTGKNRP